MFLPYLSQVYMAVRLNPQSSFLLVIAGDNMAENNALKTKQKRQKSFISLKVPVPLASSYFRECVKMLFYYLSFPYLFIYYLSMSRDVCC
jgi:hypothetical protein